jgi:uncharacterized protein YegP (UPF0339 family)
LQQCDTLLAVQPAARPPPWKLDSVLFTNQAEEGMSARYELKAAPGHQFIFYLKAANGEVILASETYCSKADALQSIESVRRSCTLDDRFERKHSARSQPFFILRSLDDEILGRSETYASEGAREKGIRSVMKNGPIADTRDLTGHPPVDLLAGAKPLLSS